MELTDNNTISNNYAGVWDWGYDYMDGSDKKGCISKAWQEGWSGPDSMFEQWLLHEVKYVR